MLVLLFILFMMTGSSFWMMGKFSYSTVSVSEHLLPELSKSFDLHLSIQDVHRKMDALPYVKSKAGKRVIVEDLIGDLNLITLGLDSIKSDKYSSVMLKIARELLPIVNFYSLEIDSYIENRTKIRSTIVNLDSAYLKALENITENSKINTNKINQIYLLSHSLLNVPTTFLFKRAKTRLFKMINKLDIVSLDVSSLVGTISNPVDGLIAIIEKQTEISSNLSVLNTQTNVIIEQLVSISFNRKNLMKKQVEVAAKSLRNSSSIFYNILFLIVLMTTLFAVLLMYFFHKNVSKRLMLIAKSIGAKENTLVLNQEAQGLSELSVIAKSMLRYITRNEQQKNVIEANVKQLMLIIENSNQAVIIYREGQIVYCNSYSEQLLGVDMLSKTNIVSQNLLVAINTLSHIDKLEVGAHYFRFLATQIDWNGKPSKLALLIDITNEVAKENLLIKTLERATDDSLTDTLTGLYNRRKLDQVIAEGIGDDFCLIITDIDWFKRYNDHYGHAAGDLCLTEVSQAIKDNVREEGDIAVRYGGEEFLIILAGNSITQAEQVASRVQTAVSSIAIAYKDSTLNHLSLSFGIAHSSELDNLQWPTIFEMADRRLYQAKKTGRAKAVSHDIIES